MELNEKSLIKRALEKGLLQIFSANFFNKIIQFGITLVLTRILDKNAYGGFVYAQNILNLFLLFEGFGSVSGILQYCSSEKDNSRKLSFFKYGLKIGMIANSIIALSILVFTLLYKLPVENSTRILMSFSALPLFTILFNEIQVFLRSTFRNKEFSILSVTNTFSYFVGNIILGLILNIRGVILGSYISYFITIALGIYFMKNYVEDIRREKYPDKKERKEFFYYSIVFCLTNSISSMLYLIDTFLVGMIVKDASVVAAYKNATLIPFNLNFIPMSIMVFAYPYFAQKSNDKKWVRDKYRYLQKYLIILNLSISLFCLIFGPKIILLIFGAKYYDSITSFKILSIGYFIAGTFRIPSGNILASIKKVKVNFYNSIISGIANIVLDIFMISKFGATGASIATVMVFIISSLISNIYLSYYLKS